MSELGEHAADSSPKRGLTPDRRPSRDDEDYREDREVRDRDREERDDRDERERERDADDKSDRRHREEREERRSRSPERERYEERGRDRVSLVLSAMSTASCRDASWVVVVPPESVYCAHQLSRCSLLVLRRSQ